MGLENYHLFLIPGFLAWNFTLGSLISSSESIIQSKYLISKIAFPNEILTLVNVALNLFDFLISIIIYLVVISFIPGTFQFSYSLLFLPLIIIIQILFTTGIGFLIACSSVYFRDIPKLVQLGGTILFFFTPIFYSLTTIPENFRRIISLNPMTQIIGFYHDVLYFHRLPNALTLLVSLTLSTAVFLAGYIVFNKFKHSFAELS